MLLLPYYYFSQFFVVLTIFINVLSLTSGDSPPINDEKFQNQVLDQTKEYYTSTRNILFNIFADNIELTAMISFMAIFKRNMSYTLDPKFIDNFDRFYEYLWDDENHEKDPKVPKREWTRDTDFNKNSNTALEIYQLDAHSKYKYFKQTSSYLFSVLDKTSDIESFTHRDWFERFFYLINNFNVKDPIPEPEKHPEIMELINAFHKSLASMITMWNSKRPISLLNDELYYYQKHWRSITDKIPNEHFLNFLAKYIMKSEKLRKAIEDNNQNAIEKCLENLRSAFDIRFDSKPVISLIRDEYKGKYDESWFSDEKDREELERFPRYSKLFPQGESLFNIVEKAIIDGKTDNKNRLKIVFYFTIFRSYAKFFTLPVHIEGRIFNWELRLTRKKLLTKTNPFIYETTTDNPKDSSNNQNTDKDTSPDDLKEPEDDPNSLKPIDSEDSVVSEDPTVYEVHGNKSIEDSKIPRRGSNGSRDSINTVPADTNGMITDFLSRNKKTLGTITFIIISTIIFGVSWFWPREQKVQERPEVTPKGDSNSIPIPLIIFGVIVLLLIVIGIYLYTKRKAEVELQKQQQELFDLQYQQNMARMSALIEEPPTGSWIQSEDDRKTAMMSMMMMSNVPETPPSGTTPSGSATQPPVKSTVSLPVKSTFIKDTALMAQKVEFKEDQKIYLKSKFS